jgi:hypothetical protein
MIEMKVSKIYLAGIAITVALGGCATNPADIAPSYIPPSAYENSDCNQLSVEAQITAARAATAVGVQKRKATGDAIAMGVGMVVFWPALFFIKGDSNTSSEVALLKGEMEAIQTAAARKHCNITFRPL